MPESRVVAPASVKLDLTGGDWILVKHRLNRGDQADSFARRYLAIDGGVEINLHQQTGMAKITAYLLDWSLVDLEGKQMVIADQPLATIESFLNAIGPEDFDEIYGAITTHETTVAAARAQKKTATGSPVSATTSPSPSAVDGATSGYET